MASRQRYEDFESYPLGPMTLPTANGFWKRTDSRPAPSIVSSSADGVLGPHGGSKMCRMNINTLVTGDPQWENLQSDNLSSVLWTNELFYRIWFRLDANHSRSPQAGEGMKILRIFSDTNPAHTGYNDLFTQIETFRGLKQTTVLNNAQSIQVSYFGDTAGDFSANDSFTRWIKVEYYFNKNGTVKVWHDGVLRCSSTIQTINNNLLDFFPRSNWGAIENAGYSSDAVNYMYIDDFEIYSDVGSGATGLMSNATITQSSGADTTPPSAPTNLRFA